MKRISRKKYILFPVDCFYCGKKITHKYEHTYDHIQPLDKGGEDKYENLANCCHRCNKLKDNSELSEWLNKITIQLRTMSYKHQDFDYFSSIRLRMEQYF